MSDAFMCDRCKEYNNGSGTRIRYGVYHGTSAFQNEYNFTHKAELCDDCKAGLDELVSEYMRDND